MNRYDLVLLGLILEKERSGYDIITEISNRELDRWANLSTSTVYNRLTTLEKNECIVGRAERDGNRPERMVFNITEKGREVLRKEVLKHLTGFNDDPRTLGFAFLYGAENKELIRTLEVHERRLVQEIENLEKMIAEEPRPTLYPEGPFLNCMSRDHILVELKYVRAAIGILRDPIRNKKLDGYFYINFGNRDFENFNQKKD
ncbi:MAG: PadR family transcriptional regulator [Fibrobacter sp.]|uniref:PadR family transcriptional regulator n=1 Tax=Fibrobacter sp. UWR2 TaxID=1964352 RepID=UPI000B51E760|nr:PadR family transcriptional regulator [Fibrobacter sp. UWR2]MBO7413499.1 PadR family transcriptional regulator [Fibrobacter sp.]OWV01293.1 PadR family transcriptional regulator [Fibrobacter sp. UWR2]